MGCGVPGVKPVIREGLYTTSAFSFAGAPVTVILFTPYGTATVYSVVSALKTGDKVPSLTLKSVRHALEDGSSSAGGQVTVIP
jgi:hypothetical protein